jgi:hypothetical protein
VNYPDAGGQGLAKSRGSPLCGASMGSCLPDDDGTTKLPFAYVGQCVTPAGAAGAADAGASASGADASIAPSACRVVQQVDDSYAPTCLDKSSDQRGVDGVTCLKSTDCAAGYDCILAEKGGVCRHYCCSGSCLSHTSKNGGPTFCDVQKLYAASTADQHKVPVCMPIKKCRLLVPGECGDRETCAVVTETGETGCVALGTGKVGDDCDVEPCGADPPNLTCLGSPGDRKCYQLCNTDGSQCTAPQICTPSTVFQDTTYGVCKDPQPQH